MNFARTRYALIHTLGSAELNKLHTICYETATYSDLSLSPIGICSIAFPESLPVASDRAIANHSNGLVQVFHLLPCSVSRLKFCWSHHSTSARSLNPQSLKILNLTECMASTSIVTVKAVTTYEIDMERKPKQARNIVVKAVAFFTTIVGLCFISAPWIAEPGETILASLSDFIASITDWIFGESTTPVEQMINVALGFT